MNSISNESGERDFRNKQQSATGIHEPYANKFFIEPKPKLDIYTKQIQPKVFHQVHMSKCIQTDSDIGVYPMKTRYNRGVFFMVNIIDFPNSEERRNGAEEDGESLLYLFKELGFKLFAYVNLTHSEFFQLLDDIIKSEYTQQTECFVMALMTHGIVDDDTMVQHVQFHDGSFVKVRDIEEKFKNKNCLNLIHKPKILIFPFCRGETIDHGYDPTLKADNVMKLGTHKLCMPKHYVPTISDVFICYATVPGFKSIRSPTDGSWYIQKFYEMMAMHAHDKDFECIVKLIQREVSELGASSGFMQAGSYVNFSFNKKLFFNPGAYED